MTDEELHAIARAHAEKLTDPDRKQLRFNDIVRVARAFYPTDAAEGVRELVASCNRTVRLPEGECPNPLYVAKAPMWGTLEKQYGWMLA
jgi:hypothetical protein